MTLWNMDQIPIIKLDQGLDFCRKKFQSLVESGNSLRQNMCSVLGIYKHVSLKTSKGLILRLNQEMGQVQLEQAGIRFFEDGVLNQSLNKKDKEENDEKALNFYNQLAPYVKIEDDCIDNLERFGKYVNRQLGLEDDYACLWLENFAEDYLKAGNNFSAVRESIFMHLEGILPEEDIDSFYTELTNELEACIVSYFSFHWDHSLEIVDKVLQRSSQPKTKLRGVVRSVARKDRLARAVKTLKTKNIISTLVGQLKAINDSPAVSDSSAIRNPVLILMGGGMGAGKSSVVKEISKIPFWISVAKNAVVVEADAFKETDLIYQALCTDGYKEMLETAELVHKSSTDAASSLLVSALNEGRDIIFDGTLSWKPFVLQTIAMVRDVHNRRYRMGPGYQIDNEGNVHEKYWELAEDTSLESETEATRLPYKIELIGVTCDPSLAVVRGVRRAIKTGRAVEIRKQLMSHKMFASGFLDYCELVDEVRLYSTNRFNHPAELLGAMEMNNTLQLNPEGVNSLKKLRAFDPNAQSVLELYNKKGDNESLDEGWKDIVLCPKRHCQQEVLRKKILRIETSLLAKSHVSLSGSAS